MFKSTYYRAGAIFTFAFRASSTSIYNWYLSCYCYNSNRVPNNAATKTVCGLYLGAL